ncbi:MAG: hypothetical protein GVY32_12810 [Gammaproteobacteria bacterium]|jgi:hypothetical protein|nr:hypothetical protein [Gammaproteobacteria bacterium]
MTYRLVTTFPLLLAAGAVSADCEPLTDFPTVIDEPGHYCLAGPASVATSSGEAVSITAGNVTFDLQGNPLTNVGIDTGHCYEDLLDTPTVGIRIVSVNNVTIRNGTLACFGRGIESLSECNGCNFGHTIENMNVHHSGEKGIRLKAWNSTIRGNHVFNTGLEGADHPAGIEVYGSGNAVFDNDVMSVTGLIASGISTLGGEANLVAGNRVQQSEYGFLMFGGSAVRYRDNLTADVGRAYLGPGIDLGNND